MSTVQLLGVYLIIINIIGMALMWLDKQKAKKHAWRIPEATLFFVAFIGGALGLTIGMFSFRHKTKHWYFRYGFPTILACQICILIYLTVIGIIK